MKRVQNFIAGLLITGMALATSSSLLAQSAVPGTAKVVRIKGSARYSTGNNVFLPLKVGMELKPGTIVQTAQHDSFVDLVLAEGAAPANTAGGAGGGPSDSMSYQPQADQNIVRLTENTTLGIDKLSTMDTGADVVSETQLDLKQGRILGNVKKMSAASKFEVKIPNGVAGIRGTIYSISADGVVRVLTGSVVIAYVGADGTVTTQVVVGGQQFDAKTGAITPIPDYNRKEMVRLAKEMRIGPNTAATTFTVDQTIYYVSPTWGHNGNGLGRGQEVHEVSGGGGD